MNGLKMPREKTKGSFKVGHPGGPGRPKLPPEVHELKRINRAEVQKVLNEYLNLTREQLNKVTKDPEATSLQLFVISLITQGINKGDPVRLGFLFDQLIGKMTEKIEVSNPYAQMSLEELKELGKEILNKK